MLRARILSPGLFTHFLLLACFLLVLPAFLRAQSEIEKLRADYAAQTNPVDRAKILAKLAPHEMAAARAFANAGNDDQALASLGKFRDEVVETSRVLIDGGIDASRHPAGFRELQISLRMFLRRLDDLMLSVQQDERSGFRDLKSDLEMAQNSLIDALFPKSNAKRPSGKGAQ
jgi:hypothetical protein